MTIDAVAQQLKLAPRQVRALEDGDFTHLPGRTFVRGFMRNYARLVRLDAETVAGRAAGGHGDPEARLAAAARRPRRRSASCRRPKPRATAGRAGRFR